MPSYKDMFSKIVFGFVLLVTGASAATDVVYCRVFSFTSQQPGIGNFQPEHVDPTLCTHLAYVAVTIEYDGTLGIDDPDQNLQGDGFERLGDLKAIAPNLKLILATGGWYDESLYISRMAQVPATRAVFIKNIIDLLQTIGFDGLDFDWEFPNYSGGLPVDKENYVSLLKELRAEFDKKNLTLFITVSGDAAFIGPTYDVPKITSAAHYISVMANYFTWSFDGVAVFDANMNNSLIYTTDEDKTLNVRYAMNAWIRAGADPTKLILDVGIDAQTFTLEDPKCHNVGCCTIGPGKAGPYSNFEGYLGYNEVCEMKENSAWTAVWADLEQSEYMYQGDQWIQYESERSIKVKAQFAKEIALAGLSFSGIDTDDFRGICGPKYPLLKAVRSVLFGAAAKSPVIIKITVDLK